MFGLFRSVKTRSENKARSEVKVTLEDLQKLSPIDSLTPHQQVLLAAKHNVITVKRGKLIKALGSSDAHQIYLLKGKVKLKAQDGKSKVISASTPAARHAIANLHPRQYQVTAKSPVTLLVFDRTIIQDYYQQAKALENPVHSHEDVAPILTTTPLDTAVNVIVNHFEHDVRSGRFVLPSIPEVAGQITDILEDPDVNASKIARKVSLDPAMAIKLVNCANSPLFKGIREITSCEEAIVRIGLPATRDLIRVFAVRDLYKSNSKAIQQRLKSHWNISKQVAAIAYILAKLNKSSDSNQALLAGAVHNIGVVPALLYAEQMPELLQKYDLSIDEFVNKTKTQMGVFMLEHWQWPEQLIDVVRHAENWQYQSQHQNIDMTDIVITANAHLNIIRKFLTCPPLKEISSFGKIACKLHLTPEKSIQILINAKKEIQSVTTTIGFPR